MKEPIGSLMLALAVLGLAPVSLPVPAVAAPDATPIEPLTQPKRAPPPRDDDDDLDRDLKRLRDHRLQREEDEQGKLEQPPSQRRQLALLQETLAPHPHKLLMEVSLVAGSVLTSGAKEGYTCNPTSHVDVFVRQNPKANTDRPGLWYGLRVAPFSGTGLYKKQPGTYGSTYFGPMVGVGKIDRAPVGERAVRPDPASGKVEIPALNGWVVTGGIAAVAELGASDTTDPKDRTNDFTDRGVAFDAPGAWAEARYLRILFGAAGFDVFAGVQSGRSKVFVYGGLGAAAWY